VVVTDQKVPREAFVDPPTGLVYGLLYLFTSHGLSIASNTSITAELTFSEG
jgi:hypothetical protein